MTIEDVGQTRFVDGMRVAREHLEHLQRVLLQGAVHSRNSAGPGKVCFGLRVQAADGGAVSIGPGVAFDRSARPLALTEERVLAPEWGAATRLHLVLVHVLRSEGVVDGTPTLLFDDVRIDARASAPPYEDDGVVFAQLDRGAGDRAEPTQRGEWYLPPADHGHTGRFVSDGGLWRYDGRPLGQPPARFDSGFLPVEGGATVQLAHGLGSAELVVQMQARRGDGTVTNAGVGTRWWYDLDDARITLARGDGDGDDDAGDLELRVMAWPLDPAATGPLLPLADAGPDQVVAPGSSFELDGSGSRAFGGHTLQTFIWTETT